MTCLGSLGFDDRPPSPTKVCFLASAGMRFTIALGFSIAGRGLLSTTYSSQVPVLNQVPLLHVLGVGLRPGYDFYQGQCFYLSRGLGGQGGSPWGRHQVEFVLFL